MIEIRVYYILNCYPLLILEVPPPFLAKLSCYPLSYLLPFHKNLGEKGGNYVQRIKSSNYKTCSQIIFRQLKKYIFWQFLTCKGNSLLFILWLPCNTRIKVKVVPLLLEMFLFFSALLCASTSIVNCCSGLLQVGLYWLIIGCYVKCHIKTNNKR